MKQAPCKGKHEGCDNSDNNDECCAGLTCDYSDSAHKDKVCYCHELSETSGEDRYIYPNAGCCDGCDYIPLYYS